MDDEAEAAREYERLRAELADFVLDALAQRIADGQEPRLSQALVDAIDRRVDEAISSRLGQIDWPDPDAFARDVIEAAGGRGGGDRNAATGSARRSESRASTRREPPPRERRFTTTHLVLLAIIGIVIVAGATYLLLRGWNAPTTANTVVVPVNTQTGEPAADLNIQQPPANIAAPTSAGADRNLQVQ